MTNPTLAEDILYSISCIQDYKYTIDTNNKVDQFVYDDISRRIERLFRFYYQLIGFDPNGEKK
jgi:hypothetical protein